jgi:phosphomannomutase
LGCEVTPINVVPNGIFPHPPEPIPENLTQLADAVKAAGADIGFVQDADADRLAIVNERGEPIGEELSVSLATEYVLRHTPGPVAVNLSTTGLIERIAQRHDCPVIRTPVGEVNVAEAMKRNGAVIGGEGSGGVIWPEIHYGRDSFCAMTLVLLLLAETGASVSEVAGSFPRMVMLKTKVECPMDRAQAILRKIRAHYSDRPMDERDGIKIMMEGGWAHIRPSRTEPVIRYTVEAEGEERANALKEEIEALAAS